MPGSAKRKRRKKQKKEWLAFQEEYSLSDDDLKLARVYPLAQLREKLSSPAMEGLSMLDRIRLIHRSWEEDIVQRRADIASGKLQPKPKKKKKIVSDPAWIKAKKLCQLNQEDIRKAKALGMSPKSLMKNIPSPKQNWKAPVKY